MDKRIFFSSVLALLICMPAFSEDDIAGKLSFEAAAGSTAQILSVKGDNASAIFPASGAGLCLRVNYHLNNSWGLFLQFDYHEASFSDADYFGALNQADGEKYKYGLYNSWNTQMNQDQSNFLIGGFYRLKLDRFAFVPRLSVGIGIPDTMDLEYQRIKKNAEEGPEYFYIHSPKVTQEDYLIDAYESYKIEDLLQFEASVQILYEPLRHLYFFVEPGLSYSPGKVSMVTESYKSKRLNSDPSNWVEAVTQPDYGNYWIKDEDSKTVSTDKIGFPPFFFINFGIGIRL